MSHAMRVLLVLTLGLSGCTTLPLARDTTRLPAHAHAQAERERQIVVTIREVALASAPGAAPKSYGGAARYQPSPHSRRVVDALARDYGLARVAGWRIDLLGVHCVVFRAPDVRARADAIRRMRVDPRVESVQPMHEFRTAAQPAPPALYADPYFRLQRNVAAIRVPEAHRWSRGRGVRLAVIDTGADVRHPDLRGRVAVVRNFVDDDAVAFRSDVHGTAVAGVIAAAVNGVGIVGVAPEVELLALKACWQGAAGGPASCNTLTLAEALAFAIEHRAAVINLSLTGPDDPLLRRLVQAALRRGVIVVGADAGSAQEGAAFPVAVPGVLAVADADATAAHGLLARIAAPGREVLTLTPAGRYDYLSGASLSSAMVSGIVALLLEQHRALEPPRVAELLERTAARADAVGTARLVNACDALASVVGAGSCTPAARVVGRASALRGAPAPP